MGEANWVCLQDCTTLRTEYSWAREHRTGKETRNVSHPQGTTVTEYSHQCRVLWNSGALEADIPILCISPYHYLGSFRCFQKIMQSSKEWKWMHYDSGQQTVSVKGRKGHILGSGSRPVSDTTVNSGIYLLRLKTAINSVAQLCLTLCDPMDHSMPGLPVHHQLPEKWMGMTAFQ